MSTQRSQSMLTHLHLVEPVAQPEHVVTLPGGEWTAWRCVALRGAGFPASEVLQLAAPACATAADKLIDAEKEMEVARQKALRMLRAELDALRVDENKATNGNRTRLNKALRDLKKGKSPNLSEAGERTRDELETVHKTSLDVESSRNEFCAAFDQSSASNSKKLVEISSSNSFREAVLWQNRRVVHTGIDALLREAGRGQRGTKQRQHEELVANYLQRYCTKNDTIGFFGPVGWASVVENVKWLISNPGSDLLKKRRVYFEAWGIDALAATLATNRALLRWAAPRLMPFIYLDNTILYIPRQPPTRISAQQAAVLHSCDGERTAKDIAEKLRREPGLNLESKVEVYHLLEAFLKKGLISWTIEVPLMLNPDRKLRQMMERIGDEEVRQPVLDILDQVEASRAEVARAAGDSERLDGALSKLEQTFTNLTGAAANRRGVEGKTYAARTLVYEDCCRNVDVRIGTEFIKSLGEPLSLLLTSAHWLTYEAASSFRKILEEVYARLARESGSPIVELACFWYSLSPLMLEDKQNPMDVILPSFQQRWADILMISKHSESEVKYACQDLRPRVRAAFDAPNPGWTTARYHSPDILVAARDTYAVEQGEFQFVLGELHVGGNTLRTTLFMSQHPSPQDLEKSFDLDLPETRVILVGPKSWPLLTTRGLTGITNPRDWYLMGTHDSFGAAQARALNIGSLVIEQTSDGLIVRTRDKQLRFDIIEVFADILSVLILNQFKIFAPCSHTPRITFDRLVVARESWTFKPEEACFAFEKTETGRFIAARRWMQAKGMPRFIFNKAPVEPKPTYVDFESPIYVEMFARLIRRTAENGAPGSTITVSEMLPGPHQNWLRDASGNAYTSELRIIAVDTAGRRSRGQGATLLSTLPS